MLFAMGIAGLAHPCDQGLSNIATAFVIVDSARRYWRFVSYRIVFGLYVARAFSRCSLYLGAIHWVWNWSRNPLFMRINELWRKDLAANVGDVLSLVM